MLTSFFEIPFFFCLGTNNKFKKLFNTFIWKRKKKHRTQNPHLFSDRCEFSVVFIFITANNINNSHTIEHYVDMG